LGDFSEHPDWWFRWGLTTATAPGWPFENTKIPKTTSEERRKRDFDLFSSISELGGPNNNQNKQKHPRKETKYRQKATETEDPVLELVTSTKPTINANAPVPSRHIAEGSRRGLLHYYAMQYYVFCTHSMLRRPNLCAINYLMNAMNAQLKTRSLCNYGMEGSSPM